MRRILFVVVAACAFAGCVSRQAPVRAVHVGADGSVSQATRSAMNGSTAPGPQEIVGVYIPFIGTGLAIKAGLEWDGATGPIVIPVPLGETYAASPCELPRAAASPCQTTRTVMVPETYMEEERRMVPKTRMVPRTVVEPAVPVPLPKAAPNPCGQPEPVACNPNDPSSPCYLAR